MVDMKKLLLVKMGVANLTPSSLPAQPRTVSNICPRFIRDGTPSGLSTISTEVPSARYGISSRWAYKNVLAFKQEGFTRQGWVKAVNEQCLRVNVDFPAPIPLTSKHFRYNMHRKIIDNIHFIPPSSYH